MKSTIFDLDHTAPTCVHKNPSYDIHIYEFTIPILAAFAVEYYTLQFGSVSCFPDKKDSIKDDKLTFWVEYNLDGMDNKLVIHYHGIRDYKLLFPFVPNPSLQKRLGDFYREAEITFENASWLSFTLMSAAIFEGILFAKLKPKKHTSFASLISTASQKSLIDAHTESIMTMVRNYRNQVHAERHTEAYVSRMNAMDIRTTLDRLIKKF